jgi:hypothetical protein
MGDQDRKSKVIFDASINAPGLDAAQQSLLVKIRWVALLDFITAYP